MQRVLHVVNIMDRGGIETLLMNIYRKIDKSQVQFDFLTHPYSEEYIQEYEEEIKMLGGKVYKAPSFVKHPLAYKKYIHSFLQSHTEYQVIHAHNLDMAAMAYMPQVKRAGRFLIAHAHNTNERGNSIRKGVIGLNHKIIRRYPDFYFACSKDAANFAFGEKIANSSKCEIIYNGIDVSQYHVDEALHEELKQQLFHTSAPIFGNVGRLASQKNQVFLLDVFANILKEKPDAVLAIIGKGGLRKTLESQAKDLGISKHVIFVGSVANVPDYLKAFDVFIFPSLYEGLGMAAVEAQAAGLPSLISSAVPDLAFCTDLAVGLSLEDSSSKWASKALAMYEENKGKRIDCVLQVSDAGFDIGNIAKKLCNFYISHAE